MRASKTIARAGNDSDASVISDCHALNPVFSCHART
jgi:hypothetical protein